MLERPFHIALLSACALSAAACTTPKAVGSAHLVERTRPSMGSELRLTAWTADDAAAADAFEAVFRDFDRLEDLMSVWRDGSDIRRLNDAAGIRPVKVSPDVRETIRIANQISELTDGTFDITFGVLSGLWKFDYQDRSDAIPGGDEISKRLPLIDYRDLVVDEAEGTAFLKRAGMRVNLGGIGKGYAVDRAVTTLRRRGLNDFMVQAGGDLYVSGRRDGRPWHLGIRDPRGPADRVFATLDLSNGTFSTSGDYERFFVRNGRRYAHILDLRTGQPATGCRSVTLVTDRAVVADALAKAVFIMGPARGMALIEQIPNVEGVIVSATNQVSISPGLRSKVAVISPPTDAP